MTKKSPTQVIEVRVSLQDKQSQQLDAIIGAYQVDKVSESIDQFLSFENFYIGITLLEIATGKEILFGTPNDIGDIINDVRNWWKANKDEFGPGLWAFIKRLIERAPLTPAQEAAIAQTATLYQNEAGIDPSTGEAYTSTAQLWAQAFGVSLCPTGFHWNGQQCVADP